MTEEQRQRLMEILTDVADKYDTIDEAFVKIEDMIYDMIYDIRQSAWREVE